MNARTHQQTHEARPPRSFRERLSALAGGTTYREPVEGRATKERAIPAAHELAAALGMARRRIQHGDAFVPDPLDVGPDIAIDVTLGRKSNAGRVCQVVADAIGADRHLRAVRRCRPWLRIVCWAAYSEAVDGMRQDQLRPADCAADDWALLTDAALQIMERLAEDAVQEAARRWKRAA